MPVRKIPKGRLTVTGRLPAGKSALPAEFESPLERDLYVLLEAEPGVLSFEPQPVWVEVPGRSRPYPPDVEVEYRNLPGPSETGRVVVEVKPRRDLRENWKALRGKFKASVRQLAGEGKHFKILTEAEIRSTYFANRSWLRIYRQGPLNAEWVDKITCTIAGQPGIKVGECLRSLGGGLVESGHLLWSIWQCVSRGLVEVDLGDPISMETPLFPIGFGLPRTHLVFPSFRLSRGVFLE